MSGKLNTKEKIKGELAKLHFSLIQLRKSYSRMGEYKPFSFNVEEYVRQSPFSDSQGDINLARDALNASLLWARKEFNKANKEIRSIHKDILNVEADIYAKERLLVSLRIMKEKRNESL